MKLACICFGFFWGERCVTVMIWQGEATGATILIHVNESALLLVTGANADTVKKVNDLSITMKILLTL